MKIGICDDLPQEREKLKAQILAYKPGCSVFEYDCGESLLLALERGENFDLLFLDIYMAGMNGIETAQKIREIGLKLPVIFLTTSSDFALSAFGVRAAAYLLKPVCEENLYEYLEEYSKLEKLADDWVISTGQNIVSLPVKSLVYCEQRGHYAEIHTEDGLVYPVRMRFAEISKDLCAYPQFVPCGSSYLVNLSFVRNLGKQEVKLADGTVLPVPRRSYTAFREAYLRFYKGGS